MDNIVIASFDGGITCRTKYLWQWDYGQILQINGLDALPNVFEAHFCNEGDSGTKTCIGEDGQVEIENEYLVSGRNIICYIFLHVGNDDGETRYKIVIPVKPRPQPTEEQPTPVQQGVITQAIAALNEAVEQTEKSAEAAAESAAEAVRSVSVVEDILTFAGGTHGN